MNPFLIIILILLYSSQSINNFNNDTIKPVIGIYGNSDPENGDKNVDGTYYPISYIYWLESAGAQVMAIHYWYPFDVIDEILYKINGILFLGGSRNIHQDYIHKEGLWEIKAKYIMQLCLKYKIPFWGTCQGFQLMGILLSNNFTLLRKNFDDNDVLHNLEITNNTKTSNMYKLFTEKDFNILQNNNSTIYNHNFGFYPNEYHNEKVLNEITIVTSISEDKNGLKFINSFEGKNESLKFYAVQYHPEKNPYKRKTYELEQNIESLKVSQKLVLNFIQEIKQNKNRFESNENNEGDRAQFDFFDTYNGTPNCIYSKQEEKCYFKKKE